MRIFVAKNAGFCFGVRNAVNTALSTEGKVSTLGELIHNDYVNARLKAKGIGVIESPEEYNGGTVIIRSHGVPESVENSLKEKNIPYIDATCPFVKKIHEIVREAGESGKTVILVGDKGHPEVTGSAGWTKGRCVIVSNESEASDAVIGENEPCCLVVQTTFDAQLYDKITKIIENKCKSVEINRTICYTTAQRQIQARELARTCDAMMIIGDKHSSNTGKLFSIASSFCPRTYFVENIADLSAVAKNNNSRSINSARVD